MKHLGSATQFCNSLLCWVSCERTSSCMHLSCCRGNGRRSREQCLLQNRNGCNSLVTKVCCCLIIWWWLVYLRQSDLPKIFSSHWQNSTKQWQSNSGNGSTCLASVHIGLHADMVAFFKYLLALLYSTWTWNNLPGLCQVAHQNIVQNRNRISLG